MDLELLDVFVERLRAELIGDPEWIDSKTVYEYPKQSVEIATLLKLVRAASGVHALDLLCRAGLFIDLGAIYRCIDDCVAEVYFILERYPDRSGQVEKFLTHFFSKTIDRHLTSGAEQVPRNKVHNAAARVLSGKRQDESTKARITCVYKTFSGYTHAGYAHIMQAFGGGLHKSFNISGVPSQAEKNRHMQLVEAAYDSVLSTTAYASKVFGRTDLYHDVIRNF